MNASSFVAIKPRNLGERVFLIADERDRASEFAFCFKDKRVEGPGHPPVYIIESQDITNQFSFWPQLKPQSTRADIWDSAWDCMSN